MPTSLDRILGASRVRPGSFWGGQGPMPFWTSPARGVGARPYDRVSSPKGGPEKLVPSGPAPAMPPLGGAATADPQELADNIQADQAERELLQAYMDYADYGGHEHDSGAQRRLRKIRGLREILSILTPLPPQGPGYEKLGRDERMVEVGGEGGPKVVVPPEEKKEKPEKPKRDVRSVDGTLLEIPEIPGEPVHPLWSSPREPMAVRPGQPILMPDGTWQTAPGDPTTTPDRPVGFQPGQPIMMPDGTWGRAPGEPKTAPGSGVAASTHGRFLDANVNPLNPEDPGFQAYERFLAGRPTAAERRFVGEINDVRTRAYSDSLEQRLVRKGRLEEADYTMAAQQADMAARQFAAMGAVAPGGAPAPGGGPAPGGTPAPRPTKQQRFDQLKKTNPTLTDDQILDLLIAEEIQGNFQYTGGLN